MARDDDGGVGLNARIVFQAPRTETYRVFATCFDGRTGNYILQIREGLPVGGPPLRGGFPMKKGGPPWRFKDK